MRVVAAPDKFRGTATAAEIADAVVRGAVLTGATAEAFPMADGGEGTLEVLGGGNRRSTVTGPLGDPVVAEWRLTRQTAVIEMAQASGLVLAGGAEGNEPLDATTAGTGELIREAVESGARRVIVAVGGSATTDGGLGALRAMGSPARYRGIELLVACDVRTPFTGAAEVFGPQKGASPPQIEMLRRRLVRLAQQYEEDFGIDVVSLARAGAAGGLAGGLAAIGAELVDGFDLVAEELMLDEVLEGADLVVTGEGTLDATSFRGKVVGGVSAYASAAGLPTLVIVGRIHSDVEGAVDAVSLVDRFGEERAVADPVGCVEAVVAEEVG
ncbi:MAG: glycerate kinase [Actinobacteria bacterium]|nr:glycerate kinase [Actinomycetota bacterium]